MIHHDNDSSWRCSQVKIDIDKMELPAFMLMDTFARRIVAEREPQ